MAPWYANVQAAKWLGCPFDAFMTMPVIWRDRALAAMQAETDADESRRARRKAMEEMGF